MTLLVAAGWWWGPFHAAPARAGSTGPTSSVPRTVGPSPTGPSSSGSASSSRPPGPPLRVVGVGDSVPSADACGCAGDLEQLATALSRTTGRAVSLANDAVSGRTSHDVLDDLTQGRSHDDVARGADLVVVEIGANDLDLSRLSDATCAPTGATACFADTLADVRSTLGRVVAQVRRLDPTPDPTIALLGYWNVGPDGAVGRSLGPAYVRNSAALTARLNTVVREVATDSGALYVDVLTPFLGASGTRDPTADLLPDGDHPNAAGYRLMATAVLDALRATGDLARWSGVGG